MVGTGFRYIIIVVVGLWICLKGPVHNYGPVSRARPAFPLYEEFFPGGGKGAAAGTRLVRVREGRRDMMYKEAGGSRLPVLFLGSFRDAQWLAKEAHSLVWGESEYDTNLMRNGMRDSALGEIMGLKKNAALSMIGLDIWAIDFASSFGGHESGVEFLAQSIRYIPTLYPSLAAVGGGVIIFGHANAVGTSMLVQAVPLVDTSLVSALILLEPVPRSVPKVLRDVSVAIGGGASYATPSWSSRNESGALFYVDASTAAKAFRPRKDVLQLASNPFVLRALVTAILGVVDQSISSWVQPSRILLKRLVQSLYGKDRVRLGLGKLGRYEPPRMRNSSAFAAEARGLPVVPMTLQNETIVVDSSPCVLFNVSSDSKVYSDAPLLSISLSRQDARLWLRFASGKVVDASALLIESPSAILDDPFFSVGPIPDHSLVRGIARLNFPGISDVLICPSKATFRLDQYHLCRCHQSLHFGYGLTENIESCGALFRGRHAYSRLIVSFDGSSGPWVGALIFASNGDDGQTRFFSRVKSGESVSLEFDSSIIAANVSVWVVFPPHSTNRRVEFTADGPLAASSALYIYPWTLFGAAVGILLLVALFGFQITLSVITVSSLTIFMEYLFYNPNLLPEWIFIVSSVTLVAAGLFLWVDSASQLQIKLMK